MRKTITTLVFASFLTACAVAAFTNGAPAQRGEDRPQSVPLGQSDKAANEINRRIAVCNADTMDYYNNSNYCNGTGSYVPQSVPESDGSLGAVQDTHGYYTSGNGSSQNPGGTRGGIEVGGGTLGNCTQGAALAP